MSVNYHKLWNKMEEKQMTDEQLSKLAGITRSTIWRLRRGKIVRLSVIDRIANVLNCDYGDLITNSNEQIFQEKALFNHQSEAVLDEKGRLKVCAYVRTAIDDSMSVLMKKYKVYYNELLKHHQNWNLKEIYIDNGSSGIRSKPGDQFKIMYEACKRGDYDLILTRDISRLSRNIMTSCEVIKKLENLPHPVGVYFESQGICTLNKSSEKILDLLYTFAKEESEKKSEMMKRSLEQRFAIQEDK